MKYNLDTGVFIKVRLFWLISVLRAADIAPVRCRGETRVNTRTSGLRNTTTGWSRSSDSPWPLWWVSGFLFSLCFDHVTEFQMSFCRQRCRLEVMARGSISVRRCSWPPSSPFLYRWTGSRVNWHPPSSVSPSGTRPTCCWRPREESPFHS